MQKICLRKTILECPLGSVDIAKMNDVIILHSKFNKKPTHSDIKEAKKILEQIEDYFVLNDIQVYFTECESEDQIRFCKLFGFKIESKVENITIMSKDLY